MTRIFPCVLLFALGCGRLGFAELAEREISGSPGSPQNIGSSSEDETDTEISGAGVGGETTNVPERDAGSEAPCAFGPTLPLLRHFAFDGIGREVRDEVTGQIGSVVEGALDGTGGVELDGKGTYVDLPGVELRSDTSRTTMMWITWRGENAREPIFHVQKPILNTTIEEWPGSVDLFVDQETLTLRHSVLEGSQETSTQQTLSRGRLQHVAIVYDASARHITIYLDAKPVASEALSASFTQVIYGERVWLGKSEDLLSPLFRGRFEDVRVLKAALSTCQIQRAYEAGPDASALCASCE